MLFKKIGKLLKQIFIFLHKKLFLNNTFGLISLTVVFGLILVFFIILLFINYFIFYDENLSIMYSETLIFLLEKIIENSDYFLFIILAVLLFLLLLLVDCLVYLCILFFI